MKVIIRMTKKEELKALPLLLRHAPGMMLRNRMYVLSEEAVSLLRDNGIRYTVITREPAASSLPGVDTGERV